MYVLVNETNGMVDCATSLMELQNELDTAITHGCKWSMFLYRDGYFFEMDQDTTIQMFEW
jgi:hypothetical protein